jgi:hypothetical protein
MRQHNKPRSTQRAITYEVPQAKPTGGNFNTLQPKAPTPVSFPPHLFIPQGAASIDIRRCCTVTPGTTRETIMEFTAPPGGVTQFISYAIFNDGLLENNYEFRCLVNGTNVLAYHGDPSNNYRISLGLGPDLSNVNLIPMQLAVQPGQTVVWTVTNSSAVDTVMGVRMVGYINTVSGLYSAPVGS